MGLHWAFSLSKQSVLGAVKLPVTGASYMRSWCLPGSSAVSDAGHVKMCAGTRKCSGCPSDRKGAELLRRPIRANQFAQGLRGCPGRGVRETFHPVRAGADLHAVGGKL